MAAIVEMAEDVILSKTLDGIVTSWNRAAERVYGYTAQEMIGTPISRLVPPERPDEIPELLARLGAGESIDHFETVRLAKDGRHVRMSLTLSPIRDAAGRIIGASTIGRDISDAVRLAARAHEAEASFRALFRSNPVPMWVYDLSSLRFLEVNDAAVAHYGYSRDEFLAMRITDIRPAEDVPRLLSDFISARTSFQQSGLWRHRRRDETLIDVEIASHTLQYEGQEAVLVVIRDVTNERQLEAQLRQAERLEGIGQLAGGIAHDFNNLITAIGGFGELLRDSLAADDPRRDDAEQVLKAAERAATLTRQLLAFGRRQVLLPEVLDLNAVVGELVPLLRRLIPESIAIETALAADVPPVLADRTQLEQALVNLAVNGRDAMPRGGRLTIETLRAELDREYVASHAEVKIGPHALLAVSDTGIGMDAPTQARIFEPFFTTKPRGLGTGLGLAMVYGLVKQLDGSIFVYSEPGAGTTFKLYFPAQMAAAAAATTKPSREPTAAASGAGYEVLLAEDDEQVRRFTETVLRRRGFTVTAVADPLSAVELVAVGAARPDLLVTDLVMPGMSGRQLMARLRRRLPALPVLFVSGYTDDTIIRRGAVGPNAAMLSKPYTADALVDAVTRLIGSHKIRR
ncbi:MAG TPA: PAS domain S-box protein [Candidatus Saccharimonadales bacterium]|nr:PAS domain S-box protein [Candidatus Saccharimonadales bacterium]